MPLVALHTASVEQRTGVLVLAADARGLPSSSAEQIPWRLRVELVRGWVHGFGVEPSPDPEPPARLRERRARDAQLAAAVAPALPEGPPQTILAHFLLLAVHARLVPTLVDEARLPHVATTPFHPLSLLRAVIDTLLGPVDAQVIALVDANRRSSLRLAHTLHTSALDPDEQAAAVLLANAYGWDELVRRSRVTPTRLQRLLRDAAAVGALRIGDESNDLAAALLKLMRDAPAEIKARRAAYHAEARAVHPDLHHDVHEEEARRLNDAMAELATRYRTKT